MRKQALVGFAGLFLSGITLTGCECNRPYCAGGRSSMMASVAPNGGGPAYRTQSQTMVTSTGDPNAANYGIRAEMVQDKAAGADVHGSAQVVQGTNAGGAQTAMLAITVPSVKLMVPINGVYSYPNGQFAVALPPGAGPSSPQMAQSATQGPMETQVGKPVPSQQSTMQYAAPMPIGAPPAPSMLANRMEEPARNLGAPTIAAPVPLWPKSNGYQAEAAMSTIPTKPAETNMQGQAGPVMNSGPYEALVAPAPQTPQATHLQYREQPAQFVPPQNQQSMSPAPSSSFESLQYTRPPMVNSPAAPPAGWPKQTTPSSGPAIQQGPDLSGQSMAPAPTWPRTNGSANSPQTDPQKSSSVTPPPPPAWPRPSTSATDGSSGDANAPPPPFRRTSSVFGPPTMPGGQGQGQNPPNQ
jgi:hypothetical protein